MEEYERNVKNCVSEKREMHTEQFGAARKPAWGITAFTQAGQCNHPICRCEDPAPAPEVTVWDAACGDPH